MHPFFPLRRWRGIRVQLALTLVVSLFCLPASASPGVLGFEEAVTRATRAAPLLAARESGLAAAREDAARAAALPDPKLMVGIENWPVTGRDAFAMGGDDMTMKRIGLMQEFPARAKREARQAIADRTVERARALSRIEQLQVQEQAAQAWLATWAAQREIAALAQMREQAATAVQLARARLAAGSGSAVDTLATHAAALELENRIDAAQARFAVARSSLARWLDTTGERLPEVGVPPSITTLPIAEAVLLSSIDRQRELLDWRYREAIAEAEIGLAAADKRPDWSITASYGQRDGSRSDMLMVELAVDLPVFTRNRQDRAIAARRAELESLVASREDARRAQREAVQRALAEWRGLKQQVERKEQQILPLARDRAQVAAASYRGGGPVQPWLDARRDEIELHVEHARHLGELGRVWAALAYLLPPEEATP